MSKTGRPPLPDVTRKEVTFRVRMTESDRAAIAKAAELNGKTDSEWARDVLLKIATLEADKMSSVK